MIDFSNVEILTFDCYGTLIDWESGILRALRPFCFARGIVTSDDEILEKYATIESSLQTESYRRYDLTLQMVMEQFAEHHDVDIEFDRDTLVESLCAWPAFPDTVAALSALKQRFQLGILSNIDRDLFAQSQRHLQVEFDWIVTAEDVESYKPAVAHFQRAAELFGNRKDKWVHVAQSLYHDIAPANALGLPCVWVDRRHDRTGAGATAPAAAAPDVRVTSMAELARLATA